MALLSALPYTMHSPLLTLGKRPHKNLQSSGPLSGNVSPGPEAIVAIARAQFLSTWWTCDLTQGSFYPPGFLSIFLGKE